MTIEPYACLYLLLITTYNISYHNFDKSLFLLWIVTSIVISDSEEEMEPIMYQPKIDLNRFQRFLEAEEKNNTLSTISGQAHLSHMDQGPIQSTRIQDTQSLQTTRGEGSR